MLNRYDELLDFTSVTNIEQSIDRFKKRFISKIPKSLNDLSKCFKEEMSKNLLKINDREFLMVESIINATNDTEAVIFINNNLKNQIGEIACETIFINGTFATVPKFLTYNCQLGTILIRYNERVSNRIFVTYLCTVSQNYTQKR